MFGRGGGRVWGVCLTLVTSSREVSVSVIRGITGRLPFSLGSDGGRNIWLVFKSLPLSFPLPLPYFFLVPLDKFLMLLGHLFLDLVPPVRRYERLGNGSIPFGNRSLPLLSRSLLFANKAL